MIGENTRFREGAPEAREAGRAGGRQSGAVRRGKKLARTILRDMMSKPMPTTEATEGLRTAYGLPADATGQEFILAALVHNAIQGDTKSIALVLDTLGESGADRRHDDMMRFRNQQLALERERAQGNEETQIANDWVNALLALYAEE